LSNDNKPKKSTPVKVKLPAKKMKDLKGFQDVIDVFLLEQEKKESESATVEFEKGHDNYSLYDFLDLEQKRLLTIENFLRIKIPNMKAHNQTQILVKKQEDRRFILREEIIKRISAENSSFITQMRMIFDQSFKK
jgi:hypothetical protein